jgi:hypothetical protein
LPSRQSGACRFYRGINVSGASLRDIGDFFSGSGIASLKIFSFDGRCKSASDEVAKASLVAIQPQQRIPLGSSGAGPYSMVVNFSITLIFLGASAADALKIRSYCSGLVSPFFAPAFDAPQNEFEPVTTPLGIGNTFSTSRNASGSPSFSRRSFKKG